MKSFFNIFNNEDEPSKKSPLKKYLIGGIAGLCLFLVVIITIITVVLAPIMMAEQMVEDTKNKVALFFEKVGNVLTLNGWCADSDGSCQKKAEQKYYEKLNEVYNDYQENGVEIDAQLITATIFYGNTLSEDKFQNEELDDSEELSDDTEIHLSDVKKLAKNMLSGSSLDYDKYRSYLEETYIPKRFSDMYTPENEEKAVKKIADEIMAFASKRLYAKNSGFATVGIKCDTVLLKESDGTTTAHDLEEYVAGVVSGENDFGVESTKMQAIAARTIAVERCNEVIENSTNVQYYVTPSESGKKAAQETEGLILTYNGAVLDRNSIAFASYPKAYYSGGFPGYEAEGAKCSAVNCSEGSDGRQWCETTIYRLPNLEPYNLKMPNTNKSGDYWNGLSLSNQQGHCYGMSQVASRYFETELNQSYEDMIKTFFSDGVEIKSMKTFATGFINGGMYSSSAPMYENSSIFFSSINYEYYLSTSTMPDPGNYGECPWYAQGRAIEIVANSNMPEDRKQEVIQLLRNSRVDGGQWYNKLKNSMLNSSDDIYEARPGSIITWATPGMYGHVGIIEDVEYDSEGKAARVLVTESWNGTGNPSNTHYSYSWQTIDAIRRYTGYGHYFVGYTYLLD